MWQPFIFSVILKNSKKFNIHTWSIYGELKKIFIKKYAKLMLENLTIIFDQLNTVG